MKKFALVVGVSSYSDPEISGLSFAARDAEEVGQCLADVCGFDEVRTLASGGQREPDHINIVDALHNLAPLLSRDDLFVFYFAGHGIETQRGTHLLTSNSRIRMPELASISKEVLSDCLSRIECTNRVLILDACRNDPRRGRGNEDNVLTSGFSRDIMAVAETAVEGVVPVTCVLFSCRQGERAYEWPDKGHGAFTYYLLEGLRGAAADVQGRITAEALGRYVEEKVPRSAQKTRTPRTQTPCGEQKGGWREILLATGVPSRETSQVERIRSKCADDVKELERYVNLGRDPGVYFEMVHANRFPRWKEAADRGIAEGMLLFAACCEHGKGVVKDETQAVRWYRKAAEEGYTAAQYSVGFCCFRGRGVAEDKAEAAKWYRKAADHGHAAAQFHLGWCYGHGDGVAEDKAEAVKWYYKAAEQGHSTAQYLLGTCYYWGNAVRQDKAAAVSWYRKAAQQGHADAQWNLAFCYEYGEGIAKDCTEAVNWYRKAADQGWATAQLQLGYCYTVGEGVARDKAEAAKWYRKAADQGYYPTGEPPPPFSYDLRPLHCCAQGGPRKGWWGWLLEKVGGRIKANGGQRGTAADDTSLFLFGANAIGPVAGGEHSEPPDPTEELSNTTPPQQHDEMMLAGDGDIAIIDDDDDDNMIIAL